MPLTKPTEFPEKNGKAHVQNDPDPDPSLSDSSLKKNKRDKKKNRQKHNKHEASDSLSSDSDSSDGSDYRCKQRKKKINQKKDPIKLCAGINQRSSGSNWMRMRSSTGYISSHL